MSTVPQYTVSRPNTLPIRIATKVRRRMFGRFLAATNIQPHHTVLDVGATSDTAYECSNYFEAWYPHKDKITAVGVEDASFLEQTYPGLRFQRVDGRDLPFPDQHFDFVHSSAVIEHVGSSRDQKRFIDELVRVSREAVFVTTPNRWYPIEFHTVLPFAHWLPDRYFRAILRGLGHHFFADEANLNLMSRRDLERACKDVQRRISTESVSLLGLPSNIILIIRK